MSCQHAFSNLLASCHKRGEKISEEEEEEDEEEEGENGSHFFLTSDW